MSRNNHRFRVKNMPVQVVGSADGRKGFNTKSNVANGTDKETLFVGTIEAIDDLTFYDSAGNQHILHDMSQGPAILASTEDKQKDGRGFTHPNLHRRIYPKGRELPELRPRSYKLTVQDVNSYRTVSKYLHSEETRNRIWYTTETGEILDLSEIP